MKNYVSGWINIMLINSVEIINFKIYQNAKFNFQNAKVILLTGDNGFGKTTVLDAIEWCLSGNMGSVKVGYEKRHTKQTERNRKENYEGIIKNRYATKNDLITVKVEMEYNGNNVFVIREQKDDTIYGNSAVKITNSNGEKIQDDELDNILKYLSNSFYQSFVCDSDKTMRFYDKSRQELRDTMADFLEPNEQAEQVVHLLEEELKYFDGDLKNKLEQYKKDNDRKIERNEKIIESIQDTDISFIKYPQKKIFETEIVEVDNLEEEEILQQLKEIGNIVVAKGKKIAITLKEQLQLAQDIEELNKLKSNCLLNKELFQSAIEKKYFDIETKEKIMSNIAVIKKKKRHYEKIFKSGEFEREAHELCQDKSQLKILEVLYELKVNIDALSSDIKVKEEGNELLQAMTDLVAEKRAFIQYRKEGNEKCPLCGGTDGFVNSKEEKLCSEAQAYIDKTNSNLGNLKVELHEKEKCYQKGRLQFQNLLLSDIEYELKTHIDTKEECDKTIELLQGDYDVLIKYQIVLEENYLDSIDNVIFKKKSNCLQDEEINKLKQDLMQLFSIVEYKDCVNCTKEELERFLLTVTENNTRYDEENSTITILNQKKLVLKNIQYNKKLTSCNKWIKEYQKRKKCIERFQQENDARIKKCRKIKNDLQSTMNEFANEQLESVGEGLYSIFQKLVKHTNIEKFQYESAKTVSRSAGAVFMDTSGKNIFNILSHGQLSVFMLSYFIANMFHLKEKVDFQVYFMDDLTNYMDDMNELAFVDFLKYQLSEENGVMEQLFFTTCNKDLEALMIHKFKNFDIACENIKFESTGKYTATYY